LDLTRVARRRAEQEGGGVDADAGFGLTSGGGRPEVDVIGHIERFCQQFEPMTT
jgi:hypothetical protein